MSSYSFKLLFETNSSWLIYERIKSLKVLKVLNFLLTIVFYYAFFCLLFFNSCSYYTIFNPTGELAVPIGIPTKEAKSEIKIQAKTIGTKISKCSM